MWADKVRQKIIFLEGLAMDKLKSPQKENNMPFIFYQKKQNIYYIFSIRDPVLPFFCLRSEN